ncbi:MAG: hypothetical protein E7356_02000 [Clostridiales bacterium]|nr:hypothetical protein [Clostridiales bacterium]
MSMELIGVATKPQALKGQFRVKPSILNFKTFKKLDNVTIDSRQYNIESVSIRDTFVIIKLEGVDTCEQAEQFRNKQIFADIEVEVDTSFDLNRFAVIISGENIGNVTNINNFGSKDILTISGSQEIMAPIIDGLIIATDESAKTITMDKNIFESVAVYED